ncbi:MAG: ABC transporter ATP-binding protein, partial [Clostridia bacterium]|nr:ABC transporter ATP-binding protein [Clostridia bacterium]
MEQLITVEDLHKSYGSKTVLDGVSFTAAPGQIIGLLGPNGCGKTTLIKILTGLIKDHTGTVRINNEEPGAYTKSIVAYLPEKTYLPDWMRPVDAIGYFSDFYKDFDKDKAVEMVSRFGLDMKQRVKTMSKGQQEKLRLL